MKRSSCRVQILFFSTIEFARQQIMRLPVVGHYSLFGVSAAVAAARLPSGQFIRSISSRILSRIF